MRDLLKSIRLFLFMTLLLGVIYPLFITLTAQTFFPHQANGSKIELQGQVIGSSLIAQKFEAPRYFWPRPSAVDFNPLPSGGSNLGPTSADLEKSVDERRDKILAAHGGSPDSIPADLLFASASGLDSEISPAAALYQSARIARLRHIDPATVTSLIASHVSARQMGLLGEERVNVLELNIALDRGE